MADFDDDDDMGTVTLNSDGVIYHAGWEVAANMVYLQHPEYKKEPVRMLPTGGQATARLMLKELIVAIKLGTAHKK